MATTSGWASLFWQAFKRSRNPMVLLDEQRRHVEVNGAYLQLVGYRRSDLVGRPVYELVHHGPRLSSDEWRDAIARPQFNGVADLVRRDGARLTVEFAGHPEVVTGQRLVLFVALRTARRGRRLGEEAPVAVNSSPLSKREREVVRLISLGADGPEIAEELHLAHNTVRTHVRNAMSKVGARSRAQLVAMSLADGGALT